MIGQLLQLTVIRSRQAGNGDFIIAGICQCFDRLSVKHVCALFSDRAAGESGLTEAAAANTSAKRLQIGSVVDNLSGWHDHLCGIKGMVEVLNDPFIDHCRSIVGHFDFGYGTIFLIYRRIKAGNINSGDLGNRL